MAREVFYCEDKNGSKVAAALTSIHVVKGEKKFDIQLTFTKIGGRKRFFDYFQVESVKELDGLLAAVLDRKKTPPDDDLPF